MQGALGRAGQLRGGGQRARGHGAQRAQDGDDRLGAHAGRRLEQLRGRNAQHRQLARQRAVRGLLRIRGASLGARHPCMTLVR